MLDRYWCSNVSSPPQSLGRISGWYRNAAMSHRSADAPLVALIGVRSERGGVFHPFVKVAPEPVSLRAAEFWTMHDFSRPRGDMQLDLPFRFTGQDEAKYQAVLIDLRWVCAGGNDGFPDVALAPVTQDELPPADAAVMISSLRQRVLHLKQIGEVRSYLEAQIDLFCFRAVIDHNDVFHEAIADKTAAHN